MWLFSKNFDFNEGIVRNNSYDRRDYESVDEKSQSKTMSRKTMKIRIQDEKG